MSTQLLGVKEGVHLDGIAPGDRPHILLIDDVPDNIALLKQLFQMTGFDVSGALSGKEALNKIHEVKPNIALLDIMMPEMDGWQTYAQLRKVSEMPVIVLSAARQMEYVIKALEMGMDDYITKPFNNAEVVARVNSVLRRTGKAQFGNRLGFSAIELVLDLDSQEIIYKGKCIQLTGRMFEVLFILAKNAPRVLSYEEISMEIWGEKSISAHNRLKYLVYLLRQEFLKIDDSNPVIKNVDRVGYKLHVEK